ncbi:hypothetical protein T11_8592 [Trichinella zimbabwensis]|uniref:Uncharacterized protein n=1 Tax=Trichinella zimbabwensis TaxID=268475 RepID=A0A0V1GN08_9BILA|nr:hypothetical protein T11_8592 [Trichinella zimbabwensis]
MPGVGNLLSDRFWMPCKVLTVVMAAYVGKTTDPLESITVWYT